MSWLTIYLIGCAVSAICSVIEIYRSGSLDIEDLLWGIFWSSLSWLSLVNYILVVFAKYKDKILWRRNV